MACEEYLELISAAVDGALSPEEEARLTAHLVDCPACRELLSDLQALHARLSQLPPVEVPEGLTERILAAVEAEKVVPLPAKKPVSHWKRWASTAAVLVLAAVGAWRMDLLPGADQSRNAAPAAEAAPAASEDLTAKAAPFEDVLDTNGEAEDRAGDEMTASSSCTAPAEAPMEAVPAPVPSYKRTDGDLPEGAEPAEGGGEAAGTADVPESAAISGEEGQTPLMPMTMMRSAPPPAAAGEGQDPAAGDTMDAAAVDGSEGYSEAPEEPQVFLFSNSPAVPDTVDEGAGVTAASVGDGLEPSAAEGLTAREALERLLEEYPVPEDAELVDTEEFLGWQTPLLPVASDDAPDGQQVSTRLEYLRVTPNGKYHEFWLYSFLLDIPAEGLAHSSSINFFAVPLDGGEVLVQRTVEPDGTEEGQAAYEAEIAAYERAVNE